MTHKHKHKHKCEGESWYCSCPATCTFIADCGVEVHFCDDCKEKYDATSKLRKEMLENQAHCKCCGEGCGFDTSFDGWLFMDGTKLCQKCVIEEYKKKEQENG